MLTLDSTLQGAQDGQTHAPILRLLSKKTVSDIPFIGNQFTTSDVDLSPKFIVHSTGCIVGLYLTKVGVYTNLTMFTTDTDRQEFSIGTTIIGGLTKVQDFSLCELPTGNIGIVYINLDGSNYVLRGIAVTVAGAVAIADYQIVSDTQPKTSVAVLRQVDDSFLLIYNSFSSSWQVLKRTSSTFASASWSSATNIVSSLGVTPINAADYAVDDFCLLHDDGDVLLFFAHSSDVSTSGVRLYNVMLSISADAGATWGTSAQITSYDDFMSVGYSPSAVLSTASLMYLSFTEESAALFLGTPISGIADSTYVVYMRLDAARQKLYVVLVGATAPKWGPRAAIEIDIPTWTISNKIDHTTVPALPSVFNYVQWPSGYQGYFQNQYGSMVLIATNKHFSIWSPENDTIINYHLAANAESSTDSNVSNLPAFTDMKVSLDETAGRVYLLLRADAQHYFGYISLDDYGPIYAFNLLSSQLLGNTTSTINRAFRYSEGICWLSHKDFAGNASYPHAFWGWRANGGGLVYQHIAGDSGLPFEQFRDFVVFNNVVYGSFSYQSGYGYENQRGLCIFYPGTGLSRFAVPSYRTANEYGFYSLTLNETTGEIYIGTETDGLVIYNTYTDEFRRLSADEIVGITPNNSDNFSGYGVGVYGGEGIVYDQVNDRFFCPAGQYAEYGISTFFRDGKLRRIMYKSGAKDGVWTFGETGLLVKGASSLNNWLGADENANVWSFWQKTTGSDAIHNLLWDKIEPAFDLTPYLVSDSDVVRRSTVNGKPNELSFALSHGYLFDPTNYLSLFSAYVKKGRKLTLEAGEIVSGSSHYANQGTFLVVENRVNYEFGGYPTIEVRAQDRRCLWVDDEQIAVAYANEYPAVILSSILDDYCDMTGNAVDLPSAMTGSVRIDAQWADADINSMVNEICRRFGYFPKVTVDDVFTLGQVTDTASVTHTYSDKKAIIGYTPDDQYSSFVNRITVTGEERDEIEVLFAEERVARLNGTAGWWGVKKEHKIYYSEDRSRTVRYPRLVKLETASSIAFQLAGSVHERIGYVDPLERFCEVEVDCPNLIPQLVAAIGIYFIGNKIGDKVLALGGGVTIPWGRWIEGTGLFLALNILGSITNYQYEIWGVPVGYIRRTVQYTDNDEESQVELGKIVPTLIEGFGCYTVSDCRFVAEFEMLLLKLQRKRVTFRKVAHLQDEEGDTIQIPHPYTGEPVRVFITDLTRKWNIGRHGYVIDEIEGAIV